MALAVGVGTTAGLLTGGMAGEVLGLPPAPALAAAGQALLWLLASRSASVGCAPSRTQAPSTSQAPRGGASRPAAYDGLV